MPFRVTRDGGPPANTIDWPEQARVNPAPAQGRTTVGSAKIAAGSAVRATLSVGSRPIKSTPRLEASGLPAGASVDIRWVNVTSNRVIVGWNLVEQPLAKAKASAGGALAVPIAVPDTLGGWHAIRLASGDQIVAELPYFVERSIDSVSPQRVKAGEKTTPTWAWPAASPATTTSRWRSLRPAAPHPPH